MLSPAGQMGSSCWTPSNCQSLCCVAVHLRLVQVPQKVGAVDNFLSSTSISFTMCRHLHHFSSFTEEERATTGPNKPQTYHFLHLVTMVVCFNSWFPVWTCLQNENCRLKKSLDKDFRQISIAALQISSDNNNNKANAKKPNHLSDLYLLYCLYTS